MYTVLYTATVHRISRCA